MSARSFALTTSSLAGVLVAGRIVMLFPCPVLHGESWNDTLPTKLYDILWVPSLESLKLDRALACESNNAVQTRDELLKQLHQRNEALCALGART